MIQFPAASDIDPGLLNTRESLLVRLKDRDDQASWLKFFQTYWKLIYSVALKAGLRTIEAEEVVQETVISVSKSLPHFRYDPKNCSFKTWLQTLTRKRIADQFRKRKPNFQAEAASPNQPAEEFEQIPDPAGAELEIVWDEEWRRHLILTALERIKGRSNLRDHQMFYLHAIKEQSVAQVAAALGVPVARVYLAKHRISRALKKEIKSLQKDGIY